MEQHEEEVLRLNRRIRELMTQNDVLDTRNKELDVENRALLEQSANLRKSNNKISHLYVEFRTKLERESIRCEQLHTANEQHKERYRALLSLYVQQSEKVKMLEHSIRSTATVRRISQVPVEIIGKVSDIGKSKHAEKRCQELRSKCDELQKELRSAYAIIDDLEFELESVDYLEDENERLQREIKQLRSNAQNFDSVPRTGVSESSSPSDTTDGAAFAPMMKLINKTDSTGSAGDDKKARRDELHRKLETLHERQSIIFPRMLPKLGETSTPRALP
ncbi:tropomyosin alpha-1 chain-like [Toxorhynchites rutilus septentrionalis]|uniref:tropomyosin alpha-1 chain-like n=1 Tax=Toxorhynchites rutilus septentrionalis TaxID=329112 RepID=UPI00247A887E|nr:tropomyosin alpha-1 chain-like [Toxorhynchites rutilus septentrionalis]